MALWSCRSRLVKSPSSRILFAWAMIPKQPRSAILYEFLTDAKEAILDMRKAGYLVATTTGFDRATTESILSRLDWKKFLVATVSSDDVARGRPSPFMLFHAMELAQVD